MLGSKSERMARVYLHIGTHKTGTTSNQFFLSNNRESLAQQGILYPHSGKVEGTLHGANHRLAWSIKGLRGEENLDCWKDLIEEISASGMQKVIISSETFSKFNLGDINLLKKMLAGHEVFIVVYLRNYKDYFRSRYSQIIQDVGNPNKKVPDNNIPKTKSFSSFIKENTWVIDFEGLLRIWGDAFGFDRLMPRCYDRIIIEDSLAADLSKLIGFDYSADKLFMEVHKKISYSEHTINAIRFLGLIRNNLPFIMGEKRYLKYLYSMKKGEDDKFKLVKRLLMGFSRKKFVTRKTDRLIEKLARESDHTLIKRYFTEKEIKLLEQ